MKPQREFVKFCSYILQDLGPSDSPKEIARFCLQHLTRSERQAFAAFVRRFLAGEITDAEIGEMWGRSEAGYFFEPAEGRRYFLRLAAEIAEKPMRGVYD